MLPLAALGGLLRLSAVRQFAQPFQPSTLMDAASQSSVAVGKTNRLVKMQLGLSPRVRQAIKTLRAVRCFSIVLPLLLASR
jgi:hypothetical protein